MYSNDDENDFDDLPQGGDPLINIKGEQPLGSVDTRLESMMIDARKEAVQQMNDADTSGINIWFTEAGFTSPFPDRVHKVELSTIEDMLAALLDYKEEPVPGTVFALTEELAKPLTRLADEFLDLELGYIPNPDNEFVSWVPFTKDMIQIHPLDIENHFQPIHLPKPLPPEVKKVEVEESHDEAS